MHRWHGQKREQFFFRKLLHIKSKSKPKTNKMKFGLTKDMVCLSYFSRFKQIEMFCLWSNVHNGHNNFIRVKCAFAGTNDDFFWFWISFHIFFFIWLEIYWMERKSKLKIYRLKLSTWTFGRILFNEWTELLNFTLQIQLNPFHLAGCNGIKLKLHWLWNG